MFDFNIYVTVTALAGVVVFLFLPVAWKVLIAFITMSQGFDLLPQIVYGHLVWDAGAIMLLVASTQLIFKRTKEPKIRGIPVLMLWIFIVWLIFSLLYSLLVYRYPVMNTLKTSRHMIIGYLSVFIFLRLFQVDRTALAIFIKWLYIATYVLLILAVVQFILGIQMFQGLVIEYKGAIRYLPVFLPICLFYFWATLSKYFRGGGIKSHEIIYSVLVLVAVATTYTRGIYLTVLVSFLVMMFVLQLRGRVKSSSVVILVAIGLLSVVALVTSGAADRVVGRATSAIDILASKRGSGSEVDVDTFTGRLRLVEERMALVAERNPLFGFGFLHENDVPQSLRSRFKYGSVIYSPDMKEKYAGGHPYVLALYSADIGWANVIVNSGFVGFGLLLVFILTLVSSYKRERKLDPALSHFRIAFFVQTIALVLLMFNGNTLTNNVHMFALLVAGYLYCNTKKKRAEADESLIRHRYVRNPNQFHTA